MKKSKDTKRKAKVKAKKQQAILNERSLSAQLASALEKLCELIMPEYIVDTEDLDLVGRRIVYQMGFIAWNIAVTGRKELADSAFKNTDLNAEQRSMVQQEIAGLVKRKYTEFPNLRTAMRDFSVSLVNGAVRLKVQPGDTFPAIPMPDFAEPPLNKTNPIRLLYDRLFELYGTQHWWPCKSGNRWEIVAGAILTQNCAWRNVEKALANLEAAKLISPEAILQIPDETLQEAIRPAGFFTQKTTYLKVVAQFFIDNELNFLQSDDVRALRKQLLAVKGVGRETADSILLYAFRKPIFVIDTYTRRVAERHLNLDGSLPYETLQKTFMDALPPDIQLYGEYHALIIALCKESCLKSKCGGTCTSLTYTFKTN